MQDSLKLYETRADDAERHLSRLQHSFDLKEQECERLSLLITASDQLIYSPVYLDQVDRKLGEYINSQPLKIRIYLMRLEREGEGFYRFGSKRAFIKIENDTIIIRVGGGFMNMEEFVEQYCNPHPEINTLGVNVNASNVPSPSKGIMKKKQT